MKLLKKNWVALVVTYPITYAYHHVTWPGVSTGLKIIGTLFSATVYNLIYLISKHHDEENS